MSATLFILGLLLGALALLLWRMPTEADVSPMSAIDYRPELRQAMKGLAVKEAAHAVDVFFAERVS